MLLVHAEPPPLRARLARPRSRATPGQFVPVGVAPGDYRIETAVVNELPEGRHLCFLARWVLAARRQVAG
jgi:hypothetical protein